MVQYAARCSFCVPLFKTIWLLPDEKLIFQKCFWLMKTFFYVDNFVRVNTLALYLNSICT